MIEAVAGAVGEVAQIAVLYPLDTIKVRCQAAGISATAVLKELSKHGINMRMMKKLYAGVTGAAATSILVGSLHYVCYCATKRFILDLPMFSKSTNGQTSVKGTGVDQPDQQQHHHHHVVHSHGATGSHYLSSSTHAGSSHGDAVACEEDDGKLAANVLAAFLTAALTAVVEAPLEMFRHNAQAGQLKGSFIKEMWRVRSLHELCVTQYSTVMSLMLCNQRMLHHYCRSML